MLSPPVLPSLRLVARFSLSAMALSSAGSLRFASLLWLVLFRVALLGVSSASNNVRRSGVVVAGVVLLRVAFAVIVVFDALDGFADGLIVSGRGSS